MSGTSKKLMSIKKKAFKDIYNKAGSPTQDEILLLNSSDETDSIYRTLGIPSRKDFIEENLNDINSVKAYEEIYKNKQAFKGSFIRIMANKYFLQLRKLDNLEGYLPKSAIIKIKEFTDVYDKALVQSSFYILAGKECFLKKYKGKEVKTFILFFIDASDTRHSYNVEDDSTLIQLYSSGNDWSENRIWLKHLDKREYDKNDTSMFNSNLLGIVIPIILSLLFMFLSHFYISIFLVLIAIIFFCINHYINNHNYKKFWNEN